MSNIFINRNRSQGAYKVPIIKQRFLTIEELWAKRAQDTKKMGDTFYKTSHKYGANIDLQDKHVGTQWSIVDSCDTVKPGQEFIEEKWNRTHSSFPLYKAYDITENPNQTYEQRLEMYPGPGSPSHHPTQQSNGFTSYSNSGGIGRTEFIKDQINSIAEKLQKAKEIKGTLCLNNGNAYGSSWRKPIIDQALQNKSGFKGGETAQRFYMKFPIYRPRGEGPPDVNDDISKVWQEQTFYSTQNSALKNKDESLSQTTSPDNFNYGRNQIRHNSFTNTFSQDSKKNLYQADNFEKFVNSLKPKVSTQRKRFNENSDEVIEEIKKKQATQSNTLKLSNFNKEHLSTFDQKSHMSKKSLSKSDLSRYFKNENGEKKSTMSRKYSGFKQKFLNSIDTKKVDAMFDVEETVDELEQQSTDDGTKKRENENEILNDLNSDQLAKEYQLLLDQYANEQQNRIKLEEEIQRLQQIV